MTNISKNLKLIRLVMDKTQAEFAQKFNATVAMIASYEKGKALPDDLFISRVAKYAGITEDQLRDSLLKEEDLKWYKQENEEKREENPEYIPPLEGLIDLEAKV